MFQFEKVLPSPKEKSKGTNTCEFVIVHHTATGKDTSNGVLNGLAYRDDFASCHFFINEFGKVYKIGDPRDILWHV